MTAAEHSAEEPTRNHSGRLFVIRPFGSKPLDEDRHVDFEAIQDQLITPAARNAGLAGSTTIELVASGNIREDMFALIIEADVVVCDVTLHNANVFYELGLRHALRKRTTLLIRGKPSTQPMPFDLLTDRYLSYELAQPEQSVRDLTEMLEASMAAERNTDSPVFRLLPELTEIDWHGVTVLPLKLAEQIELAEAGKEVQTLMQLAASCDGQRYQWLGYKRVGKALWALRAYQPATQLWERIRNAYPEDVAANDALANLYERLSREAQSQAEPLLVKSDQAIERLLAQPDLAPAQRIEALTLKGRNQKTRWQRLFAALPSLHERRAAALAQPLLEAYEAYRDAYFEDLNAYYPGINALFLATILTDLTQDAAWPDLFDSDGAAAEYAQKVSTQKAALMLVVEQAVSQALRREKDTAALTWARISHADLCFLRQPERTGRVLKAYAGALQNASEFARHAALGQLKLLQQIGVLQKAAEAVLQGTAE